MFLSDFTDHVLVRCPRCGGRADLVRLAAGERGPGYALTCAGCAHTRDWLLARDGYHPVPSTGPHLNAFGLDLWLQAPCCGEVLWAFNDAHLAFLQGLVGARVRRRAPDPYGGWSNGSLESRLPAWIRSGRNRPAVTRVIARLRRQAAGRPRRRS